jgi:hypothetical protein
MLSSFGDSCSRSRRAGCDFVVQNAYALLDALPGSMAAGNTIPLPICLSVPQPSGGRLVAFSIPVRLAHQVSGTSAAPANAHTFLAKVFQQLGLTGP